MKYFMNIECGNIFPYTKKGYYEMCLEAEELYDFDDFTNIMELWDYYEVITIEE